MRSQVNCRKRLEGRILLAGVAMLIAPLAARAQSSCTVNLTTDTGTQSGPTSGDILFCQNQATAATLDFTINFAQSLNGQTITVSQPVILGNFNGATITVQGPGANLLTISGGGSAGSARSIFAVYRTVAISGLTIANGYSSTNGEFCNAAAGAICLGGGSLTVTNCIFSGNFGGDEGGGGAIENNGGTLTVINTTFSGNSTTGAGGGIYNTGTLSVTNSTFFGNTSQGNGGGIGNQNGSVTVTNSTFFNNTAFGGGGIATEEFSGGAMTVISSTIVGNSGLFGGGGIGITTGAVTVIDSTISGNVSYIGGGINVSPGGSVTLTNSIVAGNVPLPGAQSSYGNPADECDACGTQSSNNLISTASHPINPQLSPLGNYGGPTQTVLPLPGSPALNAGQYQPGGPTTDQRGFPVPTSGAINLGAVQIQVLTVTTNLDQGGTNCTGGPGSTCSLRDALAAAQIPANNSPDIGFAPGVTGTITLNSPVPAITGYLNLVGPGAGSLTISGGGSSGIGSVFVLNPGAVAAIYGLTIANGLAPVGNACSGGGGGICNQGSLTVTGCTFSGNASPAGSGGGIFNNGGSVTAANSTFSGNTTQGNGGGIFNNNANSALTVTGSTFSRNTATLGGGIYNNGGSLTVTKSTVSGDTAQRGGGIFNVGPATLTNSIVAGNTDTPVGDDCDGCSAQSSLISTTGNSITPLLAPLGNYGGPTQTMLPLPGSPAICLGSPAQPDADATDQRGFPRVNRTYPGYSQLYQPCLDAGAVQTNYQSVQFTNAGNSGYNGIVNAPVNTPSAPIVSVTESGQNIGGVPVTLSFSGNGTATGLGPVTTVAGIGATFPSLMVNAAGTDTLSATLNIMPSNSFSITSGNVALNVVSLATTTAVSASPNSLTYGQAVTFVAAVASGFASPAGSVSFSIDGGSPIPGSALSASACSGSPANTSCSAYSTSSLNAGTHTVVATYAPAGSFQGSSGMTSVTVSKATATVTLGNLSVTYNSSAQSPTVITTPSGLTVTLTGAPDTNPGSYPVTATVNNANYTGSASGTFVINFTASAPPSGNACNGAYNGKFTGNLTVSASQNCFLTGSVTGTITQTGGQLNLSGASVGGNVQVRGGSFSFGPSTTIQGNLQVQGLPASTKQNAVCGVTVNGTVQYQNNAAPVEIGSPSSCFGNTVTGNVLVQSNTAAVTVSGNTVKGNLQVLSNTAAVTASTNSVGNNMLVQDNTVSSQIFNDVVTNNLQCSGNTSITGGGNKAGQLQGQCAGF